MYVERFDPGLSVQGPGLSIVSGERSTVHCIRGEDGNPLERF